MMDDDDEGALQEELKKTGSIYKVSESRNVWINRHYYVL